MKKISCVFIFITACYFSIAQKSSVDSVLLVHANSFDNIFKQKVHLEDMQICDAGTFFIKYELQNDGSLGKLVFSEKMLFVLKDTITKILFENKALFVVGEIAHTDAKQVVIVPVYVRINNCSGVENPYPGYTKPGIDTSAASSSAEKEIINRFNSTSASMPYGLTEYFLSRVAQSSSSLFRFDDGEFKFNQKYVILSPIQIASF